MKKMILVVGAGKFGLRAVQKLSEKIPEASISAVDKDFAACRKIADLGAHAVCGDGIWFMDQLIRRKQETISWVVPCVPIHLSWEWVQPTLPPDRHFIPSPAPSAVIKTLPNPMKDN